MNFFSSKRPCYFRKFFTSTSTFWACSKKTLFTCKWLPTPLAEKYGTNQFIHRQKSMRDAHAPWNSTLAALAQSRTACGWSNWYNIKDQRPHQLHPVHPLFNITSGTMWPSVPNKEYDCHICNKKSSLIEFKDSCGKHESTIHNHDMNTLCRNQIFDNQSS